MHCTPDFLDSLFLLIHITIIGSKITKWYTGHKLSYFCHSFLLYMYCSCLIGYKVLTPYKYHTYSIYVLSFYCFNLINHCILRPRAVSLITGHFLSLNLQYIYNQSNTKRLHWARCWAWAGKASCQLLFCSSK